MNEPKGISLSKGGNISLSKEAPGLKIAVVGLGWDQKQADGPEIDCDATVFLLNADGKCASSDGIVYFNQKTSKCGSVEHSGDNRTGDGEGDDESITVQLDKIPADVEKVAIAVTIHDAQTNGQNFGQIRNAYVRVCNPENANEEVVRYDLSEDASTQTAMVVGELYRRGDDWKFKALEEGYTTDSSSDPLAKLCEQYGVAVS